MLRDITMTSQPAAPAHPAAERPASDSRLAGFRRTMVVARHTTILVVRDPGTLIAYAVMAAVLLLVLRPVYQRVGLAGTPTILQETPGIAVMFTLLALDMAGQLLLSERTWFTWDRLRSSQAGPVAILTGKALPLVAVFLLQQAALFVFAALVFGLDLADGTGLLLAMGLCWALCVTACGLALGVWVRTQGQLAALADIVAITVTCLSGCLVPLAILPHWVKAVAPFTPGYWVERGYQAAVTGGTTAYVKSVAVIMGVTVVAFALAAVRAPRSRRAPLARQGSR